jgi:HK97 family phage portal protein
MAFLADAFARKASSGGYALLREIAGWGRTSATGKIVNVKTAIEVAAVLACVRVKANGIAQVPLKLMRSSKDGRTRRPAIDHPLHDILKSRPNEWQTSFEYREMLAIHLALCGNAFSFVNRSNRAGIMELIPFEPGNVTVKRADDRTLTYEVRMQNGSMQSFPAKSIWHVRGPSWNSWMGLEAVQIAREAVGLAMATEEQQAKMQKNGVRASGTYSVEGTLKEEQYKALKTWINENYAGPEHAGAPMVLDRNAKWLQNSMTGVDAQTIETRRFQVEEIARHLGVNPIMIFAESKNTTYASAEQMFLAHVVHTLAPDYSRIEQSIDANLLTEADRADGLYSNFVDAGLLRGSITNQKDVILGYVNGGVMFPNEGRALLDLNPDTDPASDKLRIPANIVGAVPTEKPTGATA